MTPFKEKSPSDTAVSGARAPRNRSSGFTAARAANAAWFPGGSGRSVPVSANMGDVSRGGGLRSSFSALMVTGCFPGHSLTCSDANYDRTPLVKNPRPRPFVPDVVSSSQFQTAPASVRRPPERVRPPDPPILMRGPHTDRAVLCTTRAPQGTLQGPTNPPSAYGRMRTQVRAARWEKRQHPLGTAEYGWAGKPGYPTQLR